MASTKGDAPCPKGERWSWARCIQHYAKALLSKSDTSTITKTHLGSQITQELIRLFSVQGLARRKLDAQLLLECLDHVVALPWSREIHLHDPWRISILALLSVRMKREFGISSEILDHS